MAYFIRVDAANAAVHELVAEPVQEPRAEEQLENTVEPLQKISLTPLTCKASPGA